jgi:hypothetical protein
MTLLDWFVFGLALSAPITVWVYIYFGGEHHEKEAPPSGKTKAQQ